MKRVKWLLLFSLILNVIGLVFFVIGFSTHFWLESDKNYRTSSGFESVSTRVPVKLCHNVGPRCFVNKFRFRITPIHIVLLINWSLITIMNLKLFLNSRIYNIVIVVIVIGFLWWVIRFTCDRGVVIMSECRYMYFHFIPKYNNIYNIQL